MAPGQPSMHKTFKEIKIHTAKCDQCNKHNSATIYRCEECSEQCCTPCWNQQGDDGKHLLNHALTVTIPASEAEKRRPTKRKPTRVVTKGAKKIAITNKKVEKYPVRRKVVDDDDFDDTEDDVEMGGGPVQIATAANKTTQIKKKQLKARLQMPSLHEDSSDPDVEFGPIPHFRDTTQHAMKRVGSGPSATPRRPAQGSKEQAQKKNNVAVHEGYTTDDDSPVLHVPPKATSTSSKVSFKVSNANKRKRSGSSLEDQNTFRDHHSASSRKKARTGVTPRNTEVTMNASSYPQALTNTEEVSVPALLLEDTMLTQLQTEAEIREHAKNLLLFAQGIQHSSPTPSPPITKTTGPLNTEANNRPGLTDSNTARSSSPFADLPLWPPAPTSKTAAVSSTSPPSHDYYELTAARQAQDQTTQSPAPREGMWNRTWFPTVRHLTSPFHPRFGAYTPNIHPTISRRK